MPEIVRRLFVEAQTMAMAMSSAHVDQAPPSCVARYNHKTTKNPVLYKTHYNGILYEQTKNCNCA